MILFFGGTVPTKVELAKNAKGTLGWSEGLGKSEGWYNKVGALCPPARYSSSLLLLFLLLLIGAVAASDAVGG